VKVKVQLSRGIFVEGLWKEEKDLDASIPKVDEVGVTSAPLLSMAFAFGEACKDYNEDFMLCKNADQDPRKCLKEGRKVTRCALSLIEKLKTNCNAEWEEHWKCLDKNNQMLQKCRKPERTFNDCVFNKLVCCFNPQNLKKTIPGTPEDQIPIHLKQNPSFK
jgi:NADH dehydrogenase (ubiquinone) 1 alpha subcomplex subunit 8